MNKADLKIDDKFDAPFFHKVENHIQGISRWHGVTIVSRNGQHSSETLHVGKSYQIRRRCSEPHIGGIDTTDKYLACGTYDPRLPAGRLYLYDLGTDKAQNHEIPSRPYAVGIERAPGGTRGAYILAVVARPDGSVIRWFEFKGYQLHLLSYLGCSTFNKERGARNNICLHYVDGQLRLYTMRAHLGYGIIKRFNVCGLDRGVELVLNGEAKMRAGLTSCRFGSTIVLHDGREYLMKTARNVWHNTLRVRKDKVQWKINT